MDVLTPDELAALAAWERNAPSIIINPSEMTRKLASEEYIELNDGILMMKMRGHNLLRQYRKALEE